MCDQLDSLWGDDDESNPVLTPPDQPLTHRAEDVRTPFHGKPMESHRDFLDPTNTPKE